MRSKFLRHSHYGYLYIVLLTSLIHKTIKMLSHKSDKNSIFVVPKGLILFKNNLFGYSINTFFNAKYYRESYQYAEFHLAKLIYNKYFVNIAMECY